MGESHKSIERYSPKGRRYHGKDGGGRYRAFVLGERVEWTSITKEIANNIKFNIIGEVNELKKFQLTTPEITNNKNNGVTVKVFQIKGKNIDKINNSEKLAYDLGMKFSSFLLLHNNIKLLIDGFKIKPENFKRNEEHYEILEFTEKGHVVEGTLTIVEWEGGNHKNLILCGEKQNSFEELNSGVRSGVFSHTAYLKSRLVDEIFINNTFVVRELDDRYRLLLEAAQSKIKEIYREKLSSDASIEVI